MKHLKIFLRVVLGLSLMLGLCCGGGGGGCSTETGNPVPFEIPHGPVSEPLLGTVCNKLSQCFDTLDFNDCVTGVRQVSNIDTEIGLSPGDFATYADLIAAEDAEETDGNLIAGQNCQDEINNLDCDSANIQDAFDPNDPTNFDGVENIFPQTQYSCPDIYSTN